MDLKNKVAIVTGGSRGIGFATASALAMHGCKVAICGKNEKNLSKAKKEIGKGVLAFNCDMRDQKDIEKFAAAVAKTLGKIDILVNNAGMAYYKMLGDASEKEISDMIDTNLKGLIFMTKAAVPHMAKDGLIINIASGAGKHGYPGLAAYCATKFGVLGFTEAMAGEIKQKILAVCPGAVDTDMYMSMEETRHPSLKPEHIASKIMEICENPGDYHSGSSVDVYHVSDILNHLRLKYFGKANTK